MSSSSLIICNTLTSKYVSLICSPGSCKIQHNCTASITATISNDSSVSAEVVLTHYGHDKEIQHLRIPKGKRDEIAVKIKQDVSKGKILDDISECIWGIWTPSPDQTERYRQHRTFLRPRRSTASCKCPTKRLGLDQGAARYQRKPSALLQSSGPRK